MSNGRESTRNLVVTDSQLTAAVPAAAIATPGTASVTVTTPGPGGGISNVAFFTVSSTTAPTFTNYDVMNVPMPGTNSVVAPIAVDVNGDGKLDIVAGYFDRVVMLLGKGDGSFQNSPFSFLMEAGMQEQNSMLRLLAISIGDWQAGRCCGRRGYQRSLCAVG